MVSKSHPGEFINWGLLIKFKGLHCGNPTERGQSLKLSSGSQAVYKSTARCLDCLQQARGFRTEKKTIHHIFRLSRNSPHLDIPSDTRLVSTSWHIL